MVDKKTIEQILTKTIEYTFKCLSISEMKGRLQGREYDDVYEELIGNNLLNPLEKKHYQSLINNAGGFRFGESYDNDEETLQAIDELFQYGRRLFEGLKYNTVPVIDKSSYSVDDQYTRKEIGKQRIKINETEDEYEERISKMTCPPIEQDMINRQQQWLSEKYSENTNSIAFDDRMSMTQYFMGDTQHLNYDITHKKYLKELDKEQKKSIKNIDNLMKESVGLSEDTILYRGGKIDIHLKPGDHSKFKGYTSTSFQEKVAEQYKQLSGFDNMMFVIHAPKGTKGIVGNDRDNFINGFDEHEYTLPRNIGYTVLSIDYDTMTAEIVLDNV